MSTKINDFGAKRRGLVLAIAIASLAFLALPGSAAESFTFEGAWGPAGFHLISQDAAGVEIVFSVPSLEILDQEVNGEMMKAIAIPGVMLPNNAGAPNLPGTGRFIAIPKGARAQVEVIEYRTEVFHDLNIAPAFVIPKDTDPILRYFKDPAIYGVDALYPSNPVLMSETDNMRGVDVVIVGITPFQYNPVTRELTVYKDLRVRVNFIGGTGHFGEDRLRSRWWDPILEQNLINYATLPRVDYNRKQNLTDEDNVEYLIITPNDPAFLAWADSLKNWRSQQGIITGITTLSEIGGNDATLIENYINNAYNTWQIPPAAVLLLSDYQASGSEVYGITSPLWNSYCVSDNIYADVNGNNLPDIAFARITAQGYQQLQTMIGKMFSYERTPPTNPLVYSRPLIAGGWQSDRWFILCCEVIYGYFQNELGKTPTRQYAGASGPPSSWSTNPNTYMIVNYFGPTGLGYIGATPYYLTDWSGSATGINNAINNGTFMVQHRDHGELTGWSSPSYHITDLSGLNNTVPPFVFSMNCLTGKYNNSSQVFTEAFHRMNNGALGLTAASEVSYSFVNDAYTWGLYDCMFPDFDPGYGNPNASWNLRPCFGNASGKYYLQASSWPYNPGDKTVTYHLFHHHGDAFITLYSEVPQNLTVLHDAALLGGATSFTVTANAGSLIGLTVNNQIIGTGQGTGAPVAITIPPQTPGTTMRVTVTLPNYFRYISDVQIIPPTGPYVTFSGCEINDAVTGNNNGQWDYSEMIDLSVELENIGIQTANNVNAAITTLDPLVTIIDGQQLYGNINAGDSLTIANGFRVDVASAVPDQHLVPFTLTATSPGFTWESYFSLTVNSPVVNKDTLVIQDPLGNNNGALDPGETTTFLLTMENVGHATVGNVFVTMTSGNPDVTVTGNPGAYGTLAPNANATDSYTVTAAAGMQSGTLVTMTLAITGSDGYTDTETFTILVGDERNMPCGPDAYGYKAWDNLDGGEAHPYNWIEIAPLAGGSGTVLALTADDQTVQATIPFTFRYYGQNFTQISVCTNGWLALGSTTMNTWGNVGIPNTTGPPNMVAGFWDDLVPVSGSTQICSYYNSTAHYVVVEWYNIGHYGATTNRETFEVILYDPAYWSTSTGDGILLVQYSQVTNVSSATFGVENAAQTIGIQYGFNGAWDVHAWPVVVGRTITYTTNVAGGTPDIAITMTPYGAPIQIPATGGSFSYNIGVINSGATTVVADVWCMVTLPNGNPYGPVLGPFNMTFPAGFNQSRDRTQTVPASAPAGNYTYTGFIGVYGGTVYDQASFPFTKLTSGDDQIVEGWKNTGDSFSDWMTPIATAVPESYTLGQNHPNPFNPITTISFGLTKASWVKLAVYDLMGRQVEVLVDGYREAGLHETTFDAGKLASGIYIYRIEAGDFAAVKKLILLK